MLNPGQIPSASITEVERKRSARRIEDAIAVLRKLTRDELDAVLEEICGTYADDDETDEQDETK